MVLPQVRLIWGVAERLMEAERAYSRVGYFHKQWHCVCQWKFFSSGGSIYVTTSHLAGDGKFSGNGGVLYATGYFKSPGAGAESLFITKPLLLKERQKLRADVEVTIAGL